MEFIVMNALGPTDFVYQRLRKRGRHEHQVSHIPKEMCRAIMTHASGDPGTLAARGRVRQFRDHGLHIYRQVKCSDTEG